MQLIVVLIFLTGWLLVLWTGSLLLEKTGMERSKARFQTLSALTGTGFTTREAEDIVNHKTRRRIVSWLIFIGNTGILMFIIAAVLYVKAGLATPTARQIVAIISFFAVLIIAVVFKLVDKVTNIALHAMGSKKDPSRSGEVLFQTEKYEIVTVKNEKSATVSKALPETHPGCVVPLAIDNGKDLIVSPDHEHAVAPGDNIIYFRKSS